MHDHHKRSRKRSRDALSKGSAEIDERRGREVARILCDEFSKAGLFGRREMPEDIMPEGIRRGSSDHILFITMGISIDYRRSAPALWKSAKASFEDEETRYLFDPGEVRRTCVEKLEKDMRKHSLSAKPVKDPLIWKAVATSFAEKWGGDPRSFLKACDWDAVEILRSLKAGSHMDLESGREASDFPYLRGEKIGPLWLRMLKDTCLVSEIRGLDKAPIPVDVHVARATINTGVIRGSFEGRMEELYPKIRQGWFRCVEGLETGGRPMMAQDVDNPLWHLSKHGCTRRDKATGRCKMAGACPVRELCSAREAALVRGGVVSLNAARAAASDPGEI
jgi:hypothetical protein